MNYQWYPGHMTKAKRQISEDIKLVDLIIEVIDARIPISSRNPDIDNIGKNKYRLVLLNKADLANPVMNDKWEKYFTDKGYAVVRTNSKAGEGIKKINNAVKTVCAEKIARDKNRGIKNRPIRAMVVGIPNVGKSTFINAFCKKNIAKTANKPGVTKANQWIRLNAELELLDTPGILWPKFEDQTVGKRLAFIGSINDDIIISEEMALELIEELKNLKSGILNTRYGVNEENTPLKILEEIAAKRGCLKKDNDLDYKKAADILIDEFRSGKLGLLTLESPEE